MNRAQLAPALQVVRPAAFPTSIIGPCGRFIVPMENATTAAFYGAARLLGVDPSELLAEAVHETIASAIATAKRIGGVN